MKDIKISLKNQQLYLHPYKALFWQEHKMLIISDVHFGKAAHFRKSGIPIHGSVHDEDLNRITYLADYYKPEELLFLGDLFHSAYNTECDKLKFLLDRLPGKKILVSGNHDIMEYGFYDFIHHKALNYKKSPFIFQHHPPEHGFDENYVISGHIHPAVSIKSGIRQRERLSCFYFGETYALMPAFGKFTGNYKISYKFEDNIYAVTDGTVVKIDSLYLPRLSKS